MSRILIFGVGPMPFEQPRRTYGGANRAWHFARPLRDAGHDVTLVTMRATDHTRERDAAHRRQTIEGIDFHSIDELAQLRDDAFIARLYQEINPDGVIGVNTLPAWRACSVPTEAPIWVDLMGYALGEAQIQAAGQQRPDVLYHHWAMIRVLLRRADVFSSLGDSQTCALVGELGLAGRLTTRTAGYRFVHTMPIARDPGSLAPQRRPIRGILAGPDDCVVLWQGGFNHWMDPDTLVKGMNRALAAEPRLRFVVIGGAIDGHDDTSYPRVRDGLLAGPGRERVHLQGWVPPHEVGDYLHDADVGINVDRECYESHIGGRNRITDMMHAGLPVVTTLASDITRAVQAAGCGLVFPIGDAEALARHLLWAAAHRDELRAMGERGRAYAERYYTYEATTHDVLHWAQAPYHAPDWPTPGPPLPWSDPTPPKPATRGWRAWIQR